jgi:membrane protein DedA with SNARE-associated domain
MELLNNLTDLFAHLSPAHYVFIIMAAYFVENIFPPLPGDTMLVITAYIFGMHHDYSAFIWLYGASILGAVLGFMLMAILGRYLGKQFLMKRNYKYASSDFLFKAEEKFSRHGQWVILWNRIFFGMRPVIGLVAGLSKIPWYIILGLVTLSACIFNAGFILLGFMLGDNWELIESILRQYTNITIIALVLLVLFLLIRWIRKKSRKA